ncbi:MFS transporter [Halotalea alkalilenta]|uniref:MFS transporter n=1 Tax=Halotalea alkalilenta TaxID=376489 RepID=UPI000482CEC1|nr:MFS transporter [Halotalea alkalilenta]
MPSQTRTTAFTLLSVACLTIMVGCVLVPGLPDIAAHLGIDRYISGLVTVPALGVVVLGPLAGWMIGRVGLYRTLCAGLFLYGLLGFAGAWLHGELWVFADRFLLGGATAMVMASGTGLISALYHGRARLAMMAKQGMSIELGGVIFLFVSGLLATAGWRWPFALYLLAWLLLVMVILYVPSKLDEPSEAAADAGEGQTASFSAALKIVYAAAFFTMVAFFTGVIVLPVRLHEIGVGAAEVGYFLSFVSLVAVGAAAAMPRLASILGGHRLLVFGFLCYVAAHGCFSVADGILGFAAGGILLGCGFGFTVPMVNHMTVERSHPHARGRNLAYLSMAIFSGQFASSFMEYVPGDTPRMFAAAALIALLVAVALSVAHRSRRHVAS